MVNFGSFYGIGMIVLQALRALTVISLTASAAACWIMMVKVGKDTSYFVFEAASLFLLGCICVFLAVSEFPMIKMIKGYYRRSWPLFSEGHGFTWLGTAMLLIGCNLLGRLNQPAYEKKELGLSLWQLVIASGILSVTFGVLNVTCSLIWRDGKNGINARHVRSQGENANSQQALPDYYSTASRSSSVRNEKTKSKFVSMFWKKDDAPKTFDRPEISGPYHPGSPVHAPHHDIEREVIPDRGSPVVPGLQRPSTALHPMNTGRSSRYSGANMSRF